MSVYLNYGLVELGLQYNPRNWSNDPDKSTLLSTKKSLEIRNKYKIFNDLSYGLKAEEKLDIIIGNAPSTAQSAPVYIYFHGGGWSRGNKQNACYPAEMILEKGGIFVAVNFSKIENVPLAEIVRQSQVAVAWVYHNIADYGGNVGHIFICGKSSGAHQAGMVLATDWTKYAIPKDIIKGAVLISGAYDLEPISLTERRKEIGLNEASVKALSPARNIPEPVPGHSCELILVYAENDSDEIKRQSQAFAAAWQAAGLSCQLIEEKGVDHFSIGEPMSDPKSAIGQATLALIGR